MKIYNHRIELIIDQPSQQAKSKAPLNLKKQLADAGIPVEAITKKSVKLPKNKRPLSKAMPGTINEKLYVKTGIRDVEMNPWDVAHDASKANWCTNRFY